jgi:hypothetical protein
VVFSLQALVGFTLGGLLAIVITLGAGLHGSEWVGTAGRVVGFAACGALGGAGLGLGLRPGAWKSGALGFGLAFLLPVLVVGPALTDLFALNVKDYGSGTFVSTFFAFAAGYGLAGALGASFLEGRLWLPAGLRFGAAAGLGGLVAAYGPALSGPPSAFTPAGVIGALAVVLTGHMLACSLGGWLTGLALEADVKEQAKPKAPRPKKRRYAPAAEHP